MPGVGGAGLDGAVVAAVAAAAVDVAARRDQRDIDADGKKRAESASGA